MTNGRHGAGVDVYILDTGIYDRHAFFEGRVVTAFDAFGDAPDIRDPNGLIGGKNVGLARLVTLHDVRVLGADGFGTTDSVLAGLDYVAGQIYVGKQTTTAIVNLGFVGWSSPALNSALHTVSSHALLVAATGDMDSYSCDVSPASAQGVISVGAVAYPSLLPIPNSNFGPCIDLFAPGQLLVSTWPSTEDNTRVVRKSGSSVATAVVSGLAAIAAGELRAYIDQKWEENEGEGQGQGQLTYRGVMRVVRS
eukprot:gene962-1085_t